MCEVPADGMKSAKVAGAVAPMSEAAVACQKKMMQAHVRISCQKMFLENLRLVEDGATGMIPESSILPVSQIMELSQLDACAGDNQKLLSRTVILKLNGGLGAGMGLNVPKSLIKVKDGKTIMDFIVNHILWLQKAHSTPLKAWGMTIPTSLSSSKIAEATTASISTTALNVNTKPDPLSIRFMLMNSFKTSATTKEYLSRHYSHIFSPASLHQRVELMQNQVPKILQSTFFPVEWPANPLLEWVPPGHGDIYTALYDSGMLEKLISEGFEYLFVSNSDNLGGTVDVRILQWMASERIPLVMEVCQRTKGDCKGGHLARSKINPSCYLLRESCQCPPEERNSFQDIERYQFFNTNNIWVHLPALKAKLMALNGDVFRLPLLKNRKTVDPAIPSSPKVVQLETALGSAISLFPEATPILVPREHFTPVKSCADLLAVRSDAYVITPDYKLVLDKKCEGLPPVIVLDEYYCLLDHLEELIPHGAPSLRGCKRLVINGRVQFGGGSTIVLQGDVVIENPKQLDSVLVVPDGIVLTDTTYTGS